MKKTALYLTLVFLIMILTAPAAADEGIVSASRDRAVEALLARMEEPYPGLYSYSPTLLRSYDTDHIVLQTTAFTYDNAVTAMAFLAEGKREAAKRILDAFVYAADHDRYRPGMLRNAYAARTEDSAPDYQAGGSLPGWWSTEAQAWYEDRSQVGSNPGNTSYAALALMHYHTIYGNETYLKTARQLMDRILKDCSDGKDGFTAGFEGWPESGAIDPQSYKSTEHNIDAYAAFRQLYVLTGEEKYRDASDAALRFIRSMYDPEKAFFYIGTLDDGVTPDKEPVVLDAIVWGRLALGEAFEPYLNTMVTLEKMQTAEGGYSFSMGNGNGGWWPEGTAFTALMYQLNGEPDKAAAILETLCSSQLENGLFHAATVPELSTGIELFDGSPWVYTDDPHITPAAWFILAVNGFNPYTFE